MSNSVVIYAEKHRNLPSEQAGVLVVASFFLTKGIKVKLEKLANIEYISPDGNLPLFSIDWKFYSGLETAITIIDEVICKTSNQGDQSIQGKSMAERIQYHNEVIQFNYAKCLFENVFLREEWLVEEGGTEQLVGERHAWPLSRLLYRQKKRGVHGYARDGLWHDNDDDLLAEFERYCNYLARSCAGGQFLFDRSQLSDLDLLIQGHLAVMRASAPLSFARYVEIVDRYPSIAQLETRIDSSVAGGALATLRDQILIIDR